MGRFGQTREGVGQHAILAAFADSGIAEWVDARADRGANFVNFVMHNDVTQEPTHRVPTQQEPAHRADAGAEPMQ